jgi:hypothetical protein
MREQNSAIASAEEAIPLGGVAPSVLHACRWLRHHLRNFWADQHFLQERLLEKLRPWEGEGPACWRRELGGWRLVGSMLPDDEARHDRDPKGPSSCGTET